MVRSQNVPLVSWFVLANVPDRLFICQTRPIFQSLLKLLNDHLARNDRRILLTLDCLSSHFADFGVFQTWRKQKEKSNFVFTDSATYSNIKLLYFPARCTAQLQPLDSGYYNLLQNQYRSWLNGLLLEQKRPKKIDFINKIYSLMGQVQQEFAKSCWTRNGVEVSFFFFQK